MNRFLAIVIADGIQTICIVEAADSACARTLLAEAWWTIEPTLWMLIDVTHQEKNSEVWTLSRNRVA